MTAHDVLQAQELCECIVEFLGDHPADLKSSSLISPSFTSAAQRSLFRDIILNCPWYTTEQECALCKRLCVVLEMSPHLGPHIRSVRCSLKSEVLRPLVEINPPNLRMLALHGHNSWGAASSEVAGLAARLIANPSLQHLVLFDIVLHARDLARMFEDHTPNLTSFYLHGTWAMSETAAESPANTPNPVSRVIVRSLRLETIGIPWSEYGWLFGADCPLDPSQVEKYEDGRVFGPMSMKLLSHAKDSLTELTIRASWTAVPDRVSWSPLTSLKHLILLDVRDDFRGAFNVLSAFSPPYDTTSSRHPLESLVLCIPRCGPVHEFDTEALRRVSALSLELAHRVVVEIDPLERSTGRVEDTLKEGFSLLIEQGRFELVSVLVSRCRPWPVYIY